MDTEALPPVTGGDPATAPPDPAPPPAHRPPSWAARILVGVAFLVVIVIIAGFIVRVPYTTIAPGEALSLPPRVTVEGAQSFADQRGDIRLLFVREANHVNFWQYVRARLDSDIDLVKDGDVNPGKLTNAQLNAQGLEQMAEAKNSATAVAMRAAGYKVKVAPGLRVSDLTPDMPAIDSLQWGDVILSADGTPITQAAQLSAVIDKHAVGESVDLVVDRAGKRSTIPVKVAVFPLPQGTPAGTKAQKGIGVAISPYYTFPFAVSVDTTGIGGPSAGLAMSLAILDTLTPGDLTGGARVAVTGTIDPTGHVGEIGGIEQKAVAARAAHVSIFIVPQCSPDDPKSALALCKADLARTMQRAGSKIKVVPVSTFDEALNVLRDAGGAPVSTTVPTSTAKTAA